MKKEELLWFIIVLLGLGGVAQAQNVIQISDTQTWSSFAEGGFNADVTLQILAGGDLTVNGRSSLSSGRHLIVEEGGRFTITARLDVDGSGVITMNGGEFHSTVDMKFPDNNTGLECHIWLHGGLMVCSQLQSMRARGSTLHVGGGVLRVGNTSAGGEWNPENTDAWAIVPIPPYGQVNITDIGDGWKEVWSQSPLVALGPYPADGATDVVRDPVSDPLILSWTPSAVGTKRDVYFGTDLDAVSNADRGNPLDVLGAQDQVAVTYAPGTLEYGQTYYWRIDEVNDAEPDSPWKGEVWRFTVEPYSYPIGAIAVTASSFLNADYSPERTIDGSGLNDWGEHSADMTDMWISGVETDGVWIQYLFDDTYKLDLMRVWNFNTAFEDVLGWGLKDVTVEQTNNGTDWSVLGDVTFNQGISADNYAANTVVDLEGTLARGIRLNVRNNWGELIDLYGLSEVQILRIIGKAREPQPADGSANVDPGATLAWRVGREAAQHRINLGESVGNLALVDTVNSNRYDLGGLDLALNRTFYWRIDEVNEAEIPGVWEGDVWTFMTPDFLIVDDMEAYTGDYEAGEVIWQTWVDGYEDASNGSQVGDSNWMPETTTVHGGIQSMPFYYGQEGASDSWATRTFEQAQDWTRAGVEALVLYFHGDPLNTGGRLYVEINNRRIDYTGDASSLAQPIWRRWVIDLASVNANLQNVTVLTLGVEGAGSSGVLYIDDIRLYEEAPAIASEEVWVEAESAETITVPMGVTSDSTASGGQYIGTPNGFGNTALPPAVDGIATYSLTVKGGAYQMQFRVISSDGDSFWVRVPTATTNTGNHPSGWILNDLTSSGTWIWDDVDSRNDNGETVVFTMAPGTHTLEIAYRDDGALLDAILVTDKLD